MVGEVLSADLAVLERVALASNWGARKVKATAVSGGRQGTMKRLLLAGLVDREEIRAGSSHWFYWITPEGSEALGGDGRGPKPRQCTSKPVRCPDCSMQSVVEEEPGCYSCILCSWEDGDVGRYYGDSPMDNQMLYAGVL